MCSWATRGSVERRGRGPSPCLGAALLSWLVHCSSIRGRPVTAAWLSPSLAAAPALAVLGAQGSPSMHL